MRRFIVVGLAIALLILTTACSAITVKDTVTGGTVPVSIPKTQVMKTQETETQKRQPEAPAAQSTQTEPGLAPPSAALIENLKSILSAQIGIPATEITFKSSQPKQWKDACLGASNPDELCAQVITPGYCVIFSTLTQTYEVHTDRTGKNFRLLPSNS